MSPPSRRPHIPFPPHFYVIALPSPHSLSCWLAQALVGAEAWSKLDHAGKVAHARLRGEFLYFDELGDKVERFDFMSRQHFGISQLSENVLSKRVLEVLQASPSTASASSPYLPISLARGAARPLHISPNLPISPHLSRPRCGARPLHVSPHLPHISPYLPVSLARGAGVRRDLFTSPLCSCVTHLATPCPM